MFPGKLKSGGLIDTRSIEQYYDPVKEMLASDRFIKGECPKCGAAEQVAPLQGLAPAGPGRARPYSAVSSAEAGTGRRASLSFRPSRRRASPSCASTRGTNTAGERRLQMEAANKMKGLAGRRGQDKLSDWDISRDAPYFRFEIPGAPASCFYVWLDAPIGYLASFRNLAAKRAAAGKTIAVEDYTDAARAAATSTEMVHFIGKDILYFQACSRPQS